MTVGNSQYLPTARVKREMSLHAQKRGRQRGMQPRTAELVVLFGEKEHDNRGGVRFLMTARAIEDLRGVVGNNQKVDALAGIYAVVSATGPTIITVAHRNN